VKFEYIGSKAGGVPVTFPLGVKSKMGIRKTVYADPFIEIEDRHAALFLKLYNKRGEMPCFEAVGDVPAPAEIEPVEEIETVSSVEVESDEKPAPKKRGPKPKKVAE